MNKTYYFRVTSKEDENKWKEFLGRYFPNCFASEILNKNLLKGQKRRGLHAIGVNINGYGFVPMMCICKCKSSLMQVKGFEQFTQTNLYKGIILNKPAKK